MRQLVVEWFKDDDATERLDRHKIQDVLLERGVIGSVPTGALSFIMRYEDVPGGSETDARRRGGPAHAIYARLESRRTKNEGAK